MNSRRWVTSAVVSMALWLVATAHADVRPGLAAHRALSRCLSVQLAVRRGSSGVATGHIGTVVVFKNVSRRTCTLFGYPGLQMLDAAGRHLRTVVHRGTAYTVPAVPEHVVTLSPGAESSFDLGYDDGTGYGLATCPTSSRVEITPPNAYKPIIVPWHIQPYGGSAVRLRCGQVTVSPVFAGR